MAKPRFQISLRQWRLSALSAAVILALMLFYPWKIWLSCVVAAALVPIVFSGTVLELGVIVAIIFVTGALLTPSSTPDHSRRNGRHAAKPAAPVSTTSPPISQ